MGAALKLPEIYERSRLRLVPTVVAPAHDPPGLMSARRHGPAGIRRYVRSVRCGSEIFPWTGYETNLILALDAYVGITRDAGSDRITAWSDQSSQGNDVSQGSTGFMPLKSTLDGRPSTLYDGSDDELLRVDDFTGFTSGDRCTAFAVAKYTDLTANAAIFETTVGAGQVDSAFEMWLAGGVNDFYFRATASLQVIDTAADTDAHVFELDYSATNAFEGILDGTSVGTDTTPPITVGTNDSLYVGHRANGGFPMEGHIQSILIFNATLSSDDRSEIRLRLGDRWGITVV